MIDLRADSMRLSGKGTGGLQFGPSSVIVLVRSRRQKVSTMTDRTTLNVTINGTGFAGDYTARTYGMIPHRNGVDIRLAGVTSGRMPNAERFANSHAVATAYASHKEMLHAVQPSIDNIACANAAHGPCTIEAARAGVPVIVLEKPPVIWPGYSEERTADAATRKRESMDYLAEVLDAVAGSGSRLLYAEDFVYVDGMKGLVELLIEAIATGQGRVLWQQGVCAHQGSHAPAYDTPALSGGGALFNKACHPLGPCLYLKQAEGIVRNGRPIRPVAVTAVALQVLKHLPEASGRHFRVLQAISGYYKTWTTLDESRLSSTTTPWPKSLDRISASVASVTNCG
jgi:predicted dehydrogenase